MGDDVFEIPPDLLESATDAELESYLEYLKLEHADLDRAWVLQPRQQVAEQMARSGDVFELLYGGAAAGGKVGRVPPREASWYTPEMETKVLTPFGFKLLGDVEVGDKVCNPDGTVATVLAIHHPPEQQFYRVTFADGASVEAGGEHLWGVRDRGARKRRKIKVDPIPGGLSARDEWNLRYARSYTVMDTETVRQRLLDGHSLAVPLPEPVAMSVVPGRWPLLPAYTLGVLLGDGYLSEQGISWSKPDLQVRDEVIEELAASNVSHLRIVERKQDSWAIAGELGKKENSPQELLRRVGLLGAHSWEKFIPRQYLHGPVAERWALVQGLMDTDGYADERGHVEYVTTSERLATDIQWLLRSLGFTAQVTLKPEPTFTYRGEKRIGRPAWRIYVRGRRTADLFRLERKRSRCKERGVGVGAGDTSGLWPDNPIVSVEPTVIEAGRCITVDNPNGLYVTDDFIVTHNSEWLLYHLYHLALEYPGFNGLILRRTFPELRRSLIARSWARFDRDECRYYASEHIWRFNNGSAIEFGYCESDPDVYQYQSAEYDTIAFDELTQFPSEFPYTYLMSRCRTTVDKRARGLTPHLVAATNPGGVGGGWVKDRFIDIGPPNKVYEIPFIIDGKKREVSRAFVPARRTDNRYIGEEYALALANLPDAIRAALEDGSWDTVEGQYFTEWRRDVHVVEPFEIPAHWRRIRGVDYGYTNPMACVWIAIDEDENLWLYRELYGTDMLPKQQALQINRMSRHRDLPEVIDYTVADPSIWTRTGAGPPISQQYAEAGLACRKANNARVDGWARMREFLRVDPRTKQPKMHVFSSCHNFIRTLPMLVHDQVKPEDIDTRSDDHLADACRYALMSRPLRSRDSMPQPRTPDERMWDRVRRGKRPSTMSETPVGRLTG